jgi:quinate dehydrogenase
MASQQNNSIIRCPTPPIDHLERHGYLFGYPIAHSYSPFLHHTVFEELGLPWGFQLLESTDMEHFLNLIKDPRLYGK